MRWIAVVALCGGCLHADVMECGDVVCPAGSLCLADEHRCVDPTQLDVSISELELLDVDCGTTRTVEIPLRNHSSDPIAFDARSTVQGVSAVPSEGVVMPGETFALAIVADPGPLSIPGFAVDGDLEISTSTSTHSIDVQMSSRGAIANIEGALAFGSVAVDHVKSAKVLIKNAGNAPMSAALSDLVAPFSLLTTGTHEIEPREQVQFNAQFMSSAVAAYSTTATVLLEGNFCRPVPSAIPVTGRASGDPLLVGVSSATFAPATCSVPASEIEIDLYNPLLTSQDVALVLSNADMFSVPPAITLAPLSEATVLLTRRALTTGERVGAHDATLTITGAIEVIVPVSQAIVAPVVSVDRTSGSLTFDMPATQIMIANNGNDVAAVQIEPRQFFDAGELLADATPGALQIPDQGVLPVTFTRRDVDIAPNKVTRDPALAMSDVAATSDLLLFAPPPAPPYPVYKATLVVEGACSPPNVITLAIP